MAQLRPTFMISDAAVTTRKTEVTAADFDGGMNLAGSNAPGVGVGIDAGAVVGEPQQFTLLDQTGAARDPQTSQHLGGPGYTDPADYPSSGGEAGTLPDDSVRAGEMSDTGDGTIPGAKENVALLDLPTGWEAPGTP